MSPEEERTHDAVDSEPKHYQLSYSGPWPTVIKLSDDSCDDSDDDTYQQWWWCISDENCDDSDDDFYQQ